MSLSDQTDLPITSFKGTYSFLSNFYPSLIRVSGIDYPTVEHAYQAVKTTDHAHRLRISTLATPSKAKQEGRRVNLRVDWESIKLLVMYDLVLEKFTKHSGLTDRLLATGERGLVEGNWWNDSFWGVCRGVGENHLGKILMRVRKELREPQQETL